MKDVFDVALENWNSAIRVAMIDAGEWCPFRGREDCDCTACVIKREIAKNLREEP